MSLRTASRQNGVLFAGIVFAIAWIGFTIVNVIGSAGRLSDGVWIGEHVTGGVIGTIALVFILGLVIVALSELSEMDPAPSQWPPSE